MNRLTFELSGYTLKSLSGFSKARIRVFGRENIPAGSIIFTANHFTRLETIFLPYHIHHITRKPVFSLTAAELFEIPVLRGVLNHFGAVSTRDPGRDKLILKSLLSGDVNWIIFPEGMMVKDKKIIHQNRFSLKENGMQKRPHTGAAMMALRCEFYRERLRRLKDSGNPEYQRLLESFGLERVDAVLSAETAIVPVNITYYPAGPGETLVSRIARTVMKKPSRRVMDELMTESRILFSEVDITIRFGKPIFMKPYLNQAYFESLLTVRRRVRFEEDIESREISREISGRIMEQYMGDVYAMTCLNYDHVMACILKHFPYRREGIDLDEFRYKVFHAILSIVKDRRCYFSDHFLLNQVHLLTDDRYKRVGGFLGRAEQTGVIRIRENRIIKDQTCFVLKSDFHTIRLDNPVQVMANEVEPLAKIEAFLKATAQKTMTEIKGLVKQSLIEKSDSDFVSDYHRYFLKSESKDMRIGAPLLLEHEKPAPAVLLVHGYMAAPEEMKAFAHHLYEKGYTVYAPRLKGHGTAPEDLAGVKYEQWIESVEEAFIVLRLTSEHIAVGGFSTGAGLALDLCTRVADPVAVFAVAPPMQLQDLGSYFVSAIDSWNSLTRKLGLNAIAREFIRNNPENPHINYLRNPVAGVHQLEKLMEFLEPRLKAIRLPALVVQSRKDPVVDPKGTLRLFKRLGSDFKEYFVFDCARHGILTGEGSLRVFNAIEGFIRQWADGRQNPGA